MADVKTIDRQSAIAGFSLKNTMWVILTGILVGIIVWGGAQLIETHIIERLFCGTSDGADICTNKVSTSYNIALLIGSVIGLILLVRVWIYRPLLISIASIATLWGMGGLFSGIEWFISLPLTILLFVLSYLFYAWIGQIRNFIIVLAIVVVVVIGLRFVA